jgi:hypothetical protein
MADVAGLPERGTGSAGPITARLHQDDDTDVFLAARVSDARLSRFHFCRAFNRRNPERLAEAHALAAIALQRRQSLWGSRKSSSIDHHGDERVIDTSPG